MELTEKNIGNTPLVRLENIERQYNLKAHIYAKLEGYNPAGSVKDRVALNILNDAEDKGLLKKGGMVIEPTSGNTGIGLAFIGVKRGYNVVIVMPDNMSKERIDIIKGYGATLILTDHTLGMKGAIDKAEEIQKQNDGSIIAGQFTNPANPEAHYKTTGPEIYSQLPDLDYFVAGIGTGGTISGNGKYLKEQNKNIKIIGVEPLSSPVITAGKSGPHKIQGIGANFIPKTLDLSIIDKIITVSDDDAINTGKSIEKLEKCSGGISSGAALFAAISLAKLEENSGKKIVVLFPDDATKYQSIYNN